jgi:HYR domain/Concanavalin A-like lectin/glucanases superfamily/Secretion system C-terminal sorting domain/PA14 domain
MRLNQLIWGFFILLLSTISLTATGQTTYIGPNDGSYHTVANWTSGLPAAGNNGLIPGGGVNVVVSQPITLDYTLEIYSSLTSTAPITIGATGNLAAAGTLTLNAGSSLTNNGTYNNFGTTTFVTTSSFTNAANATFVNGGTFTLPGTLNNSGSVTNNGTLNAANGLIQTQGVFSNNQTMTVKSLTISANSQFVNNFGANLTVSGAGAIFDAAGNVTNNGTVNLEAVSTISGIFDNNVVLNILAGKSLNVTASGRINNGGTVLNAGTLTNSGTIFNNNNFYNEGAASNFGVFAQNNRLENRAAATWNNEAGSTMNMGFGAVILNAGTFNQKSEMISTGTITNDGIYTVSGSIINNSGGVIDNNKTFTNTGVISSFNAIVNDDNFYNEGRINVGSGCIITNNKVFINRTSGFIRNEFEIVNTTGATFTNNGKIENIIRIFVNGGTFSNQSFIENAGDIFTKVGGTLSNSGYLQQSAGNIKNEGSLTNSGTLYSDDCSTVNNTGSIANSGLFTLRAVLFQRGTLTGTAIVNDGGYIHTATTSAAPAVCATRTITADVNGVVKAYATGLITFATFDSCQNMIYTANDIARPTFSCADVGTTKGVNLRIVTRLQDSLTCVASVVSVDALAPDFANCPSDITVNTPNNTVNVTWTAPTVTDNCTATPTLMLTKQSGTGFNVGVTAVTYTATDGSGNTQACQFKVSVIKVASTSVCTNDATGPVFTGCPSNLNIATDAPSTPVIWQSPSVADACLPLSVTTNFPPGTTFGQGKTIITYTAKDGNNNTSTCQFVITLFKNDLCGTDTQKPVYVRCPTNLYLPTNTALNGALALWSAPQVGDNCAVVEQLATSTSGSVFPVGTTAVTYTAKDAKNNTATCQFTVTVGADPCPGDVTGPVFANCPANISNVVALGNSTPATWTAPTATDACSPVNLQSDYTSGASFNVGVTKVTYTASDRKGNKTTCAFTVTINTPCSADATAPIISGCPADITVTTTAASAAANWVTPVATDPCGVAGFTSSYTPGAVFPVGTTQVVYTASDFKGNTSSCIFNVVVANAPACTTNGNPINNSTAVAPASLNLTWNSATGATAYDVYLGLTSTTTKLIAPDVATTSTIVTNLNGGTDYFWYVVPKNGAGAAANCTSITKFTTSGTPFGGGTGTVGSPTDINNNLPICKGISGTGLTVQTWNNLGGELLDANFLNLAVYPNSPTSTALVAASKAWNLGDLYGTRVRGFVTAPATGAFIFNITGDDQTRLFISTDENPATKVLVASVPAWTYEFEYTKYPEQTSGTYNLIAGRSYYIEILQKEGGGSDGWGLSWKTPSNGAFQYLPLAQLSPIGNCGGGTVTAPVTSTVQGSQARANNGLIAFYDFKEAGGNTIQDKSGYGAPLDLNIANSAAITRLPNNCGVRISSSSIMRPNGGVSSSKLSDAINYTKELTLEAWVRPNTTTQSGPARIMTFSQDPSNRNFLLGQEQNDYVARVRTTNGDLNGLPTVQSVDEINTSIQHVVYTLKADGKEQIYVDNELMYSGVRSGAINFNPAYTFALGNEVTNDRPWLGDMYMVAVYYRALDQNEIAQNYHFGYCSTNNINVCDNNLLANGGFEKDLYGWAQYNAPTVTTTNVISGSRSAQICNDGGIIEQATVVPGRNYVLNINAKITTGTPWGGVGIKFLDANYAVIGTSTQKDVTSTTSSLFTVNAVAPSNAAWIEAYAWKSSNTGCLIVDNACLTDGFPCAVDYTVINQGACVAKLYWFTGTTEIFYTDIAAGATVTQSAYNNTTWRLRRSSDAVLINEFTFNSCNSRTTTISSCGSSGSTGPTGGTGCPTDTQVPTFTNCPSNQTVNATAATATATWTAPTANDNCGTPLVAANYASGAAFKVGATTVRYTAFDTKGNTATCQFVVTVNNPCMSDTQAPVFAGCPTTQSKTTSDVTTQVTWTVPTATDNCGTPIVTATHQSGQYFAPGTTVVRYTAVDAKGNVATCQFNVVVTSTNQCANDTQAPVITLCPSNQSVTTTATSAQVNWQSPFVDDNCGLKTFVVNLIPGLFFPVGVTTVSYVATDIFDNKSTCSFTVTVSQGGGDPCANDVTKPVLSACPANIAVVAAAGANSAAATWVAPTATDNCPGAVTVTSSAAIGQQFAVGATTVTYTAKDAKNNTATCAFTVTVTAASDPCATDVVKPVLTACPANVVVNAAAGATSSAATWVAPTATDNCPGAVTVTASATIGQSFAVGATTVTYTAKDAKNNTATCAFTVTVNAATANPTDCGNIVITPGPSSITVSGLTAPIALIQIFDANYNTAFSCAGNCNQPTQVINNLPAGTYYLKIDFLNAQWGALCQKEQTITVTAGGTNSGVLTFVAPANVTVSAPAGQNQVAVSYVAPTASTTCTTGMMTVNRSSGLASGAIFPVGTNTVCYLATDGCGNSKEVCFNVVVNPTSTGGTGSCNDITITPGAGNITVGGLVSAITYLQVFDGQFNQVYNCAGNCPSPTVVVGNLLPGQYYVKASLANASWVPTCSKELFVNVTAGGGATTVLSYNAPANINITAASGATTAAAIYTVPAATSTCTTGAITYVRTQGLASGAQFPVGTTKVCYTAQDGCGNTKSVCFDVIIAAPVVTGGNGNCASITFAPGAGTLTIGNLASPVVMIQIFNASYAPVANCVGNCTVPTQVFTGLTPGTYFVKVDFLDASWGPICQRNETVTVVPALMLQSQLGLTAQKVGKTTDLRWLSNTGNTNDYFDVERSVDGVQFEQLFSQLDARTAAQELKNYNQVDNTPNEGDNFYRLKLVSRDGSVRYSDVQKVNFSSFGEVSLFPNPASQTFYVNLLSAYGKEAHMSLYNTQGQLMSSRNAVGSNEAISWDATDLDSGVYLLKVEVADQRTQMLKVVIQN